MSDPARADHEAAFRRAGLPLFIDDYSAQRDVWTRAVPILALVFFVEVLGAVDVDFTFAQNLATVALGLAILLGSLAVVNRLAGRPALARPQDVGIPELTAFVLVPALLPAVLNGQVTSALVTAAGNLTLLLLLYGVIGYGLLSILVWAGRRLVGQLTTSLQLVARAVPLLLIFSVVLFINVSVAVGGFFLAFGALVISDELVEGWIGHGPSSVVDLGALGLDAKVSRELLHVSGAIAALSGLYYAIAVLTDGTYRAEFLDELTDEMRSSFTQRAAYLAAAGPGRSDHGSTG